MECLIRTNKKEIVCIWFERMCASMVRNGRFLCLLAVVCKIESENQSKGREKMLCSLFFFSFFLKKCLRQCCSYSFYSYYSFDKDCRLHVNELELIKKEMLKRRKSPDEI